jgi:hypothetical protein
MNPALVVIAIGLACLDLGVFVALNVEAVVSTARSNKAVARPTPSVAASAAARGIGFE